ncbi:MAG: hypothetical protein IKQ99_02460 [Alphaproteobacteria bacterium]|nr:hypothetical protein [Alphaproteobacteria bacterium]
MPQFDTTFLFSQIFWMLFSFGVLYLGIRFIVFPMFDKIFEQRNKVTQEPVEKAEGLTQEIQKIQTQIEQKQQQREKRSAQRLQQTYQTAVQHLEKELQKTDKNLASSLKKSVQKMEKEEMDVLDNSADFVTLAAKGKA